MTRAEQVYDPLRLSSQALQKDLSAAVGESPGNLKSEVLKCHDKRAKELEGGVWPSGERLQVVSEKGRTASPWACSAGSGNVAS